MLKGVNRKIIEVRDPDSRAVRHSAQGAGRAQKAAGPGRGGGRAAAAGCGAGAALRQSGSGLPAISRIFQILIKPPVDHGSAGGFCLERL